MIYRQGDVLLRKLTTKIPKKAFKIENNERIVLAYGEATGHAHALKSDYAQLYEWQGSRLLEVKKSTSLTHEEHSTIILEPGIYKVIQQREYAPGTIRRVYD